MGGTSSYGTDRTSRDGQDKQGQTGQEDTDGKVSYRQTKPAGTDGTHRDG